MNKRKREVRFSPIREYSWSFIPTAVSLHLVFHGSWVFCQRDYTKGRCDWRKAIFPGQSAQHLMSSF